MAYLLKTMWRSSILSPLRRSGGTLPSPLVYSEEVLAAKTEGKPIVALESTIITHGMPYPNNLETALQVENIIRERGAIPATIAILKGRLSVGLTENQIKDLAQAKGVVKASRRDLAPIAAAGLDGATTVAGTIVAAELADIPIFVTGGIGGVHREGESTLDISADLNELGRSKTLVVCSGVKSILDIERTLEYLETQGVCVCSFGQTTDFPAFYTMRSGFHAPYHVENAQQAAEVLNAAIMLRLQSGIVIAVPVPKEHAMDESIIQKAIKDSLAEAKKNGIKGKEVTPFILAAVAKITGGASLAANIALIKNNAKVGADIAVEFKKLKNVDNSTASNIGFPGMNSPNTARRFHTSCASRNTRIDTNDFDLPRIANSDGDVLVIGGANVDRTYRVTEDKVHLDGSTHPCTVDICGGGVGRNIAEALWRLRKGRVRLLTAVGDDADGRYLADMAPGLLLDGCVVNNARTPTYAAVLDAKGECMMGLGDMCLHDHITPEMVDNNIEVLNQAPLVIFDGNIPESTMDHVMKLCNSMQKPVFFEPTDKRKAVKALKSKHHLSYASPNIAELRAMASFLKPEKKLTLSGDIHEILTLSTILSKCIGFLIVTLGPNGVVTVRNLDSQLQARFYPSKALNTIQSVSGAGDCFASGFIHGMLLYQKQASCVTMGTQAAKCALLTKNNVPYNLRLDQYHDAEYIQLDIGSGINENNNLK